jgi:hypothetical protein
MDTLSGGYCVAPPGQLRRILTYGELWYSSEQAGKIESALISVSPFVKLALPLFKHHDIHTYGDSIILCILNIFTC